MRSATPPNTKSRGPTERALVLKAALRNHGIDRLAAGAAMCAVPASIAVSETFLFLAASLRLIRIARHRCCQRLSS
jgi:hypothetical protein